MTMDIKKMLESKRVHREQLASHPIVEKLRMLDELRAREVAIRSRTEVIGARFGMLNEDVSDYRTNRE